jgi:hypothetical protein
MDANGATNPIIAIAAINYKPAEAAMASFANR